MAFGAATAVMQLGANRSLKTIEKTESTSVIPKKIKTIEDLTAPALIVDEKGEIVGAIKKDTPLSTLKDFSIVTTKEDMVKSNEPIFSLASKVEEVKEKTFGVADKVINDLTNIKDSFFL